jgi:Bacterial regulatory protein, Fis family
VIEYTSIPALVALIFKFILLGYTVRSPVRNSVTTPFLALLVAFTLLNLDEFIVLNYIPRYGMTPTVQAAGFVYIGLWGPLAAILLHLSLALSVDGSAQSNRWLLLALYAPFLPIEFLLFFTDKLVLYFRPFLYSIFRVPGPWYWVCESLVVSYLIATVMILLYGARTTRSALARTRNRLWLLALMPLLLLTIYLIVAHHFGSLNVTFPVYVPLALTFFLLMTTYATHERPRPGGFYRFLYRLFDIESYLPWSDTYRRKSALYNRIRELIARVGDFGSVKQVVRQLSDVLQCPIALMDRAQVAAQSGASLEITNFPRDTLLGIDNMVVAHELTRSRPQLHALMTRHKVAAIVPFHPRSRAAAWMLLGEAFSEQVYTPIDFDEVRKLFGRLADYLLDEQMRLRSEVTQTQRQTRELQQSLDDAAQRLNAMSERVEAPPTTDHPGADTSAHIGPSDAPTSRKTLYDYVAELERRMIEQALADCGGNQAKAAVRLGVRANTLHYMIQRYGLSDKKSDK